MHQPIDSGIDKGDLVEVIVTESGTPELWAYDGSLGEVLFLGEQFITVRLAGSSKRKPVKQWFPPSCLKKVAADAR